MVQPDYNENCANNPEDEATEETYETLDGAADDLGVKYEYLSILLHTLELAFAKTIKDFKISTNNKSYPSFDDVVLELTRADDTKETYAIQLKHGQTEASSTFTEGELASKKKTQFCFRKYFDGFKQLKKQPANLKLVLYTNKDFVPLPGSKKSLDECGEFELNFFDPVETAAEKLPKKQYVIKIVKHDKCILTGLNTSQKLKGFIYKLTIELAETVQLKTRLWLTDEEYEDYQEFFENFYIYASQANVSGLEQQLLEKQAAKFKLGDEDDVQSFIQKYHKYIKDWYCVTCKVKVKLGKSEVESQIIDAILSPYVKPASSFSFDDKCEMFEELESNLKTVDELWTSLEIDEKIRLVKEAVLSFKLTIVDEVSESICKIWGEDQGDEATVPIILQVDASKLQLVERVMELTRKTRFVLIGENIRCGYSDGIWQPFQNLFDLKKVNVDVFNKILDKFTCDFQGRKGVTLREITNGSDVVLSAIHVHHILQTLFDPSFSIGDGAVDIPNPPFINRRVPKLLVGFDSLRESENEIFVINRNGRTMKCNELPSNVVILEEPATKKKFDEIVARYRNQNVHRLDLIEDGLLEWISVAHRKHGPVLQLLEADTKCFVKDSEVLTHFQNNVNVLIAGSGMGKTTMFHYFKRHAPTSFWPIRIDLMMAARHLIKKRKVQDILRDLIEPAPDEITHNIRNVYKANKKILILFDGIDCLKSGDVNLVIAGIKILAQLEHPIWIAAKHHLKNRLEAEFGTISLTLSSAGQYDQELYITQRLKPKYRDEEILNIIEMGTKSKGLRDMFEVPITLFMFTDLWLRCVETSVETPKITLTLTDLYRSFIEARLDFYFSKSNIVNANCLTSQIIGFSKEFYKELYVKAALKTCFDIESQGGNYAVLLETIRDKGDEIGFITHFNEDNVPVFSHQTYAEFLAASYLAKEWKNNKEILIEFFKEKHANVRYMFDMLMAEACPAHLAVLERSLDQLVDVSDNILDKGGRNALHLACSWGVQHPLLNTVGKARIYHGVTNIYDTFASVPDEDPVYIEMIKLLLSSNASNVWECDEIFKWNALDYADHSLSLAAIDTIAGVTDIEVDMRLLPNFKDINSVLSYAIKFNYENLWQLIEPKPFFYIEPHSVHTPLALIIHYNRRDFLVKILENSEYLPHINDVFHDRSLLQYALKNGHVGIAKILIDNRADINAEYLGEYPILVCVKNRHVDLIKNLIHCNVDLDVVNRAGRNVLYLAAYIGLVEIFELLDKSWLRSKVNTTKDLIYVVIRERHFDFLLCLINNGLDITAVDDKGRNALNLAVKFEDKDILQNQKSILKYIINTGKFDINAPDQTHYANTPLEMAILKNDVTIVEFLIEKGCNTSTKGKDYLQKAFNHKNYEIAEYIISSNKFDINLSEKSSYLDRAIERKNIKAVKLLLKYKADASDTAKIKKVAFQLVKYDWCRSGQALYYLLENYGMIDATDEKQNTLLHFCVKAAALELITLLLDRNAAVTTVNGEGKNLIHVAAESNCIRTTSMVLERSELKLKINDKDNSGNDALHAAVKKGNLEIIKLLLDNGADISSLDGGGRNVLHQAARKKHAGVFDYLVNKVEFSLEATDNFGNTVLFYAVTNEAFHIAQQLMSRGAKIDAVNKLGMNILHAAADATALFTVKYLVEVLKLDPNKVDGVGKRPIDRCFDVDMFKYLLNCTDCRDIGYLFRNAIQRMYCHVIEYLAKHDEYKRHINDVDKAGNSALHLLMFQTASDKTQKDMKTGVRYFKSKFRHCFKELIEAGADVNLENKNGKTPLSLAREKNHEVALNMYAQYGIADVSL